jgi:hypothetical protein
VPSLKLTGARTCSNAMALSRLGELHGVAAADISFGQIQLTDKLRFSRHVMKKRHKDTIRRDVAVKRAADLLARQTDTVYALDALAILQEVMGHFYYKAKVLKTMGADADFEAIDDAMEKAGKWAKEIVAFKHARIMAIRLPSDPNAPIMPEHMTLDELRDSIMADIERLREMGVLNLPRLPQGVVANS